MAKARSQRLRKLHPAWEVETEPEAPGLQVALEEMGPNALTDLADELRIEGFPKPRRGHFPTWKDLGTFRDLLTDLMVGRKAAFSGGIAIRSYGARRAPAEDYDILLDLSEQKIFRKFLEKQGFHYIGPFENTDKFKAKALGFAVDLIRAQTPLFTQALLHAGVATWRGKRIKIVSPDYLCAMKAKAFDERRDARKRDIDRRDFLGLLKMGASADEIGRILKQTAPDLLPTLKTLLAPVKR